MERETGDAAVGRDVLVLLADRLAQAIHFDFTRQCGEFAWMQQAAAVRVERTEECGRKTARRPKARPRGDIRERRDLNLRRPESDQPHGFADDRVLHLVDAVHVFELRVLQVDAGRERPHDGDVDVLVDRRGDEEAGVIAIVRGQVGTAAAKRDPEGTTRNDHARPPPAVYPDLV